MTGTLILFSLLLGIYVLAPTLVASTVIRLVFGWYKSRKHTGLALLFSIPQTALIILGGGLKPALLQDGTALYIALLATAIALIFWGRATFRAGWRYFRVEIIVASVITILFLGSVNWIVK